MKMGILTEVLDRANTKTGVPYYCEYLIKHLLKLEISDCLCFIRYTKRNAPVCTEQKEIVISSICAPTPFKELLAIFKLPLILKKERIKIIHVLSPTIIGMIFLLLLNCKKILTIHDLYAFVFNPKLRFSLTHLKIWLIIKIRRFLFLLIRKRVDKFIAVSKNTRNDLIKYLKIPQNKIEVVYLAQGEEFCFKKQVGEKINFIKKPFILTHHMGIGFIEIFHKLKIRGLRHKLVIFGKETEENRKRIYRVASKFDIQNEILFAGYLPKEVIIDLYNRADLFVRYVGYEGFGLPVLEAMACGCPVIASKVGSLPEIVRGAGLLIDPKNEELWVKMIYRVLTDNKLRERLINKGLERAKKFSWDKVAQQTSNVYQQLQRNYSL